PDLPGGLDDADDPAAVVQPTGQVGVEQHLVDPDLRGEVDLEHAAPPLLVGVGEELVAGDPGVVHDRVDAAGVPEPLGHVPGDAATGVGGGDVELERGATDPVGHLGQALSRGRDVDGDHEGTVPGEGL